MRIYVDNAAPDKLKGLCLFFVRCRNDVAINSKTIHEVRFKTQVAFHIPPVPFFTFPVHQTDMGSKKMMYLYS